MEWYESCDNASDHVRTCSDNGNFVEPMSKQYPLRPKRYSNSGRYNKMCECGHEDINHKVSNQVLMTHPPQYTHLECEECMCPEYKHEKTITECLDCAERSSYNPPD